MLLNIPQILINKEVKPVFDAVRCEFLLIHLGIPYLKH